MRNKEPDFSVGLQIFCNSERGVEKGWGGVGRWGLLHYLIRQRGVRTEIVSHI